MNFEKFHSQLDLPFLETDIQFIIEIFRILQQKFGLINKSKQKLIDLGAGNGSIVIFSALNYNIKSYGVEINQKLIDEANTTIRSLKKEGKYNKRSFRKIKIKLGDFYLLNLKDYDYIYIYSLPSMHKYLKHVISTVQKGAIIISHKYPLNGFNSLLKKLHKLSHDNYKQNLFTFFYKKIR
ncbi:MAG: class I SAM-dependent methyltransferase [Candidatus Hermodarchaeota archaeon]